MTKKEYKKQQKLHESKNTIRKIAVVGGYGDRIRISDMVGYMIDNKLEVKIDENK